VLRPGNAGASTAADHIRVAKLALAQLPPGTRPLISAGGTHDFIAWLHRRRLQYSVGFPATAPGVEEAVRRVPARAWTPGHDAGGVQRPGARVAELTGLLDLSGWPPGMPVIARKERPHLGAQLRLTDVDGNCVTCFATPTRRRKLAGLELAHRAAGPGARTASATPRTPACALCRCAASPRTTCGARSPPWPASSLPGPDTRPACHPGPPLGAPPLGAPPW
jgi:hypothetical protein